AVLLDLDLLHAASHLDFRTVIQVAGFRALKPDHFAVFFCHEALNSVHRGDAEIAEKNQFSICLLRVLCVSAVASSSYAKIFVTTPDPTVLPPSRTAKRSFSSIAIGAPSSTSIVTLSPGMTISAPPSSLEAPVTSVVRKQNCGRYPVKNGVRQPPSCLVLTCTYAPNARVT